jgi:hypothetical protein
VDRRFYFDQLYPFQNEVLALLGQVDQELYLSGGTAASRGYLHHRFSDDLDLFANDSPQFGLWADRTLAALGSSSRWQLHVELRESRFVRATVSRDEVRLKIELVNDVPSRVGLPGPDPVLGRLDSAENILANKISALLDREEPKDLADIWGFCTRLGLSLSGAIGGAQGKAAGIFPAEVARLLCSTSRYDWERIRWIEAPNTDSYVKDLHSLGESLLLPP